MPVFIMLTRISPDLLSTPQNLAELEREATERIRAACPQVEWLHLSLIHI